MKVLINGQAEGTDIVNDASCFSQSQILGALAPLLFLKLFHTETTGSLPAITPGGTPVNVDRASPSC